MDTEVFFLGTRGSVSTDNDKYRIFGCATASVLVKTKEDYIVFDAGSGFMNINDYIELKKDKCNLNLFLSHTHFDHIMGLVACDLMFNPNINVAIHGVARNNLSIKQQINKFMSEPIWPVNTTAFKANLSFHDIEKINHYKNYSVEYFNGCHPGGSSVYKLSINGKTIIYATDIEIDMKTADSFISFAKDADLLICDGQYGSSEKIEKTGYGHSYWRDTVDIAIKCNCKALRIIHHDPYSDDNYLLNIERQVLEYNPNYFLAKRGDSVIL